MKTPRLWIVMGALVPLGLVGAFAPSGGCAATPGLVSVPPEDAGPEWIGQKSDSLCGLDDPALLSHPALVQYGVLVDLTPEMRKLREEGIDPRSAAGIQLLQRAADRVRDECEYVRVAEGHCSIWKRLRHRDGRIIPDVTQLVTVRIRPPTPR